MSSFPRLFAFVVCIGAASPAFAAEFITYFQPTPIVGQLSKTAWGTAAGWSARPEQRPGGPTMSKWAYWDGKIIKGPDGKYHLLAAGGISRGHAGYPNSVAIHAVSDAVLGPYVDQGICYPDNEGGKGHNVTAIAMSDGRYGIVVSDTRPGDSIHRVFPGRSLGLSRPHTDRQQRAHHHAIDRQHEHHAASGWTLHDRTARRLCHDQRHRHHGSL